jgi:hypothetical protein
MFDLQARYYAEGAEFVDDEAFVDHTAPVTHDPVEEVDDWADYEIEYAEHSDAGEAR